MLFLALLRALACLTLLATACDRGPSAAPQEAGARAADAAPVNVSPLPSASVAELVNPEKLPAYTGPTGSVEGLIRVTGAPPRETPADFGKCPDAAKTYGHAFREGPARALADAVVAVTGYKGFYIPEGREAKTLAVRGCAFEARTMTLTIGQRVDVRNLTVDFWTPKLEPSPPGLVMMAVPGGEAIKLTPRKVGYHRIVDHDRAFAVTELYVFRHALHTVSAADGTYRIDGVPVGKVTINTMHPSIDGAEASKEIEIRPNVIARVDLELANKAPSPATKPDGGTRSPSLR